MNINLAVIKEKSRDFDIFLHNFIKSLQKI